MGTMASVGDVVVCLCNKSTPKLKIGNLYTVKRFNRKGLMVLNETPTIGYNPDRFLIVPQPTISKLAKLNYVKCTNNLGVEGHLEFGALYTVDKVIDGMVSLVEVDAEHAPEESNLLFCQTRFYKLWDQYPFKPNGERAWF